MVQPTEVMAAGHTVVSELLVTLLAEEAVVSQVFSKETL